MATQHKSKAKAKAKAFKQHAVSRSAEPEAPAAESITTTKIQDEEPGALEELLAGHSPEELNAVGLEPSFNELMTAWAVHNRNLIVVVTLVIAAVVGGIMMVRTQARHAVEAKASLFVSSVKAYGDAVVEFDTAARATKMAEARRELTDASRTGDPATAALAQYLLGNSWLAEAATEQNATRAIADYEKALRMTSSNTQKAMISLGVGSAYGTIYFLTQNAGEADKAIQAYKQARSIAPNSALAAESTLAMARLLSGMPGREQEAMDLLAEIEKSRAATIDESVIDAKTLATIPHKDEVLKALSPRSIIGVAAEAKKFATSLEARKNAAAADAVKKAEAEAAKVAANTDDATTTDTSASSESAEEPVATDGNS